MKVKIDDIIVGERVREELGDLTKLAESLKKHGLIHPIVIDEDMRLIAGERRLEAAKMIGWNEIDVVYRTQLTERQKRILELEENLHRKDFSLSEYEKSKRLVELAELKAEELRKRPTDNQIMPTPGKKSGRGRPKKTDSQEIIAREVGIPRQTLQDAYVHVKAVEQYPELKPLPKTHAIQIARQLNSLPELERSHALKELHQIQEAGKRKLQQIDDTFKVKKVFDDAVYSMATLIIDDERINMWLSDLNPAELQRKWELIEEGLENLTVLQRHFKRLFGGPRIVKIGGGGK